MAAKKVIFVTGGNNGVGYETVKALLESDKPYHVFLGSRTPEKTKVAIETLHRDCKGTTNTVEAVQLDLFSDEQIQKAYEQVKASTGHIDCLINNAGMHHTSYISYTISCILTSPSGDVRYRIHQRQCLSPRLLRQGLRWERGRRAGHDLHLHAAATQVERPSPNLRVRSLRHPKGEPGLLPHAAAAGRMAQDHRFRDDRIPLQQDGAQLRHARLEPQAEGGRGQGVGCLPRVSGYGSGQHQGESGRDGREASERRREGTQECCGGGEGC